MQIRVSQNEHFVAFSGRGCKATGFVESRDTQGQRAARAMPDLVVSSDGNKMGRAKRELGNNRAERVADAADRLNLTWIMPAQGAQSTGSLRPVHSFRNPLAA